VMQYGYRFKLAIGNGVVVPSQMVPKQHGTSKMTWPLLPIPEVPGMPRRPIQRIQYVYKTYQSRKGRVRLHAVPNNYHYAHGSCWVF